VFQVAGAAVVKKKMLVREARGQCTDCPGGGKIAARGKCVSCAVMRREGVCLWLRELRQRGSV